MKQPLRDSVRLVFSVAFFCVWPSAHASARPDGALPRVWMSAASCNDMEETIRMCAEQGVDCVEVPTRQVEDCRRSLASLRKYGVKGFTATGGDPSKDSRPVVRDGKPCERAVCIAGAYRGLAIDRNVFSFAAGPHEIVVEPPVYSVRQPYTRRKKNPDGTESVVRSGHYFGSFRPTGKAEIVVPERPFDGLQHVRIVPCEVLPAGPEDKPENDTAAGMSGPEIESRRLVRLKFDLSDCADCLLDKVGIAVYWESDPEGDTWKRGTGQLSVFSELTRERARYVGWWRANQWVLANGGTFPSNEIVAIRFGDECFNLTGWVDCPAASCPLWGFSESGAAAFAAAAARAAPGSGMLQPRTLGFPEIYGEEAYGIALYEFHKACAGLVRAFREGVREVSPDLLVFRNTTRAGVWNEQNDRDGSGQELLARELDIVHVDPYPIHSGIYAAETIPCDMGYVSGFARRFGKPLVPWMQAHAYAPNGLGDVTPADMKRMWGQHLPFGPSGMMWLGFNAHPGNSDTEMTFPVRSPESWAYAKELFAEVHGETPSAPAGRPKGGAARGSCAIVRPYSTRAARCWTGAGWRNPADCHLEAWALAWGVDCGLQYDVFEMPPFSGDWVPDRVRDELSRYPLVVSTRPIPGVPGVRVLGAGTDGTVLDSAGFAALRKSFKARIAALRRP